MALKEKWEDKIDGESDVLAEDINDVAHAVIELEEKDVSLSDFIVQNRGDSEDKVMSQKAVMRGLDDVKNASKEELVECVECILACLEKVAWAVPDGQKYYDKLYHLYKAQIAKSNIFTINDSFIKSGFIADDGSVNTTIDSEYNFYWDKFIKAYAFALLNENNINVAVTYRYACYDEGYNFTKRGYDSHLRNAFLLTDVPSAYYKLGFKNTSDSTANKALIASTKVDSLCTINNATLNTSGEIEEFEGRISSEYFKVYDNEPILLYSVSSVAIMCIYDKDFTLIDRQVCTADINYAKIIQMPEGAKYCRVCTTPSSAAYTSLELQA
jgi:hypothetical protein